jgi:hypothetical protein
MIMNRMVGSPLRWGFRARALCPNDEQHSAKSTRSPTSLRQGLAHALHEPPLMAFEILGAVGTASLRARASCACSRGLPIALGRPLQGVDVDLLHLQQRLHDPSRSFRISVAHHFA